MNTYNMREACGADDLIKLKGFKVLNITNSPDDNNALWIEFFGPYGEKALLVVSDNSELHYFNELEQNEPPKASGSEEVLIQLDSF